MLIELCPVLWLFSGLALAAIIIILIVWQI